MAATIISPFENMSVHDMPAFRLEKKNAGRESTVDDNSRKQDRRLTTPVAGYSGQQRVEQSRNTAQREHQEQSIPRVITQQHAVSQQQLSVFVPVEAKSAYFHDLSSPVTPLVANVSHETVHAYSHPSDLLAPPTKSMVMYYDQQQSPQPFIDIAPHHVYPMLTNAKSNDSLLDEASTSSASSVATISQQAEEDQSTIATLNISNAQERPNAFGSHGCAQNVSDLQLRPSYSSPTLLVSSRASLRLSSIRSKLKKIFLSKPQQQQFPGSGGLSSSYNQQSLPTIPIVAPHITTAETAFMQNNNKLIDANTRYSIQTIGLFTNNEYEQQPKVIPQRTSSLHVRHHSYHQQWQPQLPRRDSVQPSFNNEDAPTTQSNKRKCRNTVVVCLPDQEQLQFFTPVSPTATAPGYNGEPSSFGEALMPTMKVNKPCMLQEQQSKKNKSRLSTKRHHHKKVKFDKTVTIYVTYSEHDYDRRPVADAEFLYGTSHFAIELLKQELNLFKMNEMQVHQDSIKNTHLLM